MMRQGHWQRWTGSAAILVALMGFVAGSARSESPNTSVAIKDIVPHRKRGDEACFEGTFEGQKIHMEDWSKTTHEVVPGLLRFGEPVTRPVPGDLPDQDVSRILLHLTYENRKKEQSFDFMFTVAAQSKSLSKELFARSGCILSGWSAQEGKEVLPETKLACWVECDGGSMTTERIPGTGSLNLSFGNLAMQDGCEGGGQYRVGTDTSSKNMNFRLEKVPLQTCKPLKAWAREHWPVD